MRLDHRISLSILLNTIHHTCVQLGAIIQVPSCAPGIHHGQVARINSKGVFHGRRRRARKNAYGEFPRPICSKERTTCLNERVGLPPAIGSFHVSLPGGMSCGPGVFPRQTPGQVIGLLRRLSGFFCPTRASRSTNYPSRPGVSGRLARSLLAPVPRALHCG
jgi:hypothetical protein